MKIANSFKLANVKALFTKAAMIGLVAGAAFMAAPAKANAQIAVGIRFGRPIYRRPVYVAPVPIYAGPAYGYAPAYGYDRRPDWDRDHRYDRGRDFDRDHSDRDHRGYR
jgi:hypothetical protein